VSPDDLGPLETCDIRLPRSGARFRITRPTDMDWLINAMEHDPEEILPHWAEIWPSGIALADEVLLEPERITGQRVLELGCGLGTTAIAALHAGADLTVTDYATGALALCMANSLANTGRQPAQIQINWRKPDDAFLMLASGGFPVVLAADVLYEARDIAPLLDLAQQVVAPGGLLWLAEPGRPIAREFVKRAGELGWPSDKHARIGPWAEKRDAAVTVTVHRLYRPPSPVS
jgi:predicted nicotinamide N-methyase